MNNYFNISKMVYWFLLVTEFSKFEKLNANF